MLRTIIPSLLLLLMCSSIFLVTPVQAQDQRRLCKKFWPKVRTEKCISLQEAGRKKLSSGTYYCQVVETCRSRSKIIDRKAVYINYYEANRCAVKEQSRVVLDEQRRANAKRNKAQAEYYKEAAKSERRYRDKYLN